MCPPSKQPGFLGRRRGKEARQHADEQRRVRSLRTPVTQILPNWSDAQVALQSHKQMVSKTSQLHEKSYPSDHEEQDLPCCQKCARKQRATMVGTSHAREENGGKSDPRVRFLVK